MARSMPRYRRATFHVLKTPVSFLGLSSSRRITGFLEANIYQKLVVDGSATLERRPVRLLDNAACDLPGAVLPWRWRSVVGRIELVNAIMTHTRKRPAAAQVAGLMCLRRAGSFAHFGAKCAVRFIIST